MNSIIDLNVAANVNVNQQSSYAISFGTNAGNASLDTDAYGTHIVPKQVPLNSVSNAVRDILIDVQFPNFPTQGIVSYIGPYGNIGVQRINNTTWRVSGIRDVNRYNEAFANLQIRDTGISTNSSYTYGVAIQDQYGNNENYSTAVFVRALPVLTNTGNVLFDEDTMANITQLSISAAANSVSSYVLTSSIRNQSGQVSNTTTSGNTVTITGNIATINAAVTAGDLKFMPAPDLAVNVANALNFQLSINNNLVSQANANVTVGNVSSEFSLDTLVNYTEDVTAVMVSSIIDIDPDPISYTVTWQQTAGNTGAYFLNGTSQTPGAPLIITNSKANINAANVAFLPAADDTGNVTLTYTQVKLGRDGREYIQANAVPVSLTCTSTHSEFTITSALNYTEDTAQSMVFDITDTNTRVNDYSIVWQQITPDPDLNPGRFAVNGVAQGLGEPVVITASKSTINAANVFYLPPSNFSNTVVLSYSQSVNTQIFGTVSQGTSNVTLTNTASTADYNALGANTISFIRDRISLNNWSIPDNDIPSVFGGPRTYTWQLNNVSNVGNIWLNGVQQTSNVITLTGNLTTINTSLANVSSYWEETANAEFTTAGFTTANTVFNFNLARTGPDARVLASNVVSNVTVNVPSTNDTKNNLGWQGGFYTGSNNGNIVTIVWPYISGNVGTPFGSDISGYTNRFTTSSLTVGPPITSTTDGYNNTETLKTVGFVSANVCIQPAHWTSVTTENNKSDWYLPSSTQIVTTVNNLGIGRLVPQISDPIWTSTVVQGDPGSATNNIIWYNPFGANTQVANSYANLRTQSGMSIQTARTVPHREVWTQSNYYNIPYTNTGSNGVRKGLSDWYVGLREDSYTYNVNLNCDVGDFVSNASVIVGNTYSRNAIAGGSQLFISTSEGVSFLPPLTGSSANITITVTRNDGLVVLNNANRLITLSAPGLGADWRLSQGGFYGGEFDSTGANSTPDVFLVYQSEQPADSVGIEFVDDNVNIAMPSLNSQFNGPQNTADLYAFDSANLNVVTNAVDFTITIAGTTYNDWYLPSINEMTTANVPGWSSTINLDSNVDRPRKVAYKQKLVVNDRGNITFQEMFTSPLREVWTPMRRVPK